jgi:hypothetical protein
MDLTEGSETSANIKQTLGKHSKVNTVNTNIFDYLALIISYLFNNKFPHEEMFLALLLNHSNDGTMVNAVTKLAILKIGTLVVLVNRKLGIQWSNLKGSNKFIEDNDRSYRYIPHHGNHGNLAVSDKHMKVTLVRTVTIEITHVYLTLVTMVN